MLKGLEGLMLRVCGPEIWPAFDSTCVTFPCAFGPVSLETNNFESMLATTPADPAAAIVKETSPASSAPGVPESVRLLLSSDSQGGPETKEYCSLFESLWKVVGAN